MKRHRQALAAGWRNLRYRWHIGAPWMADALLMIRRMLKLGRHKTTPRPIWRQRLRACRTCPVYDKTHRTCGNNQGLITFALKSGETGCAPNGCGCPAGIKASYPEQDCYFASVVSDDGYQPIPSRWRFQKVGIDTTGNTTQPVTATTDEPPAG